MGDIWPSTTGKITIGRLGENERLRVHFPIANMLQELGEASFTLLHRSPGETTAYPIPTAERDGEYVIWTVASRDTQTEGTGECQLVATVDGVIAKTMIWTTEITRSLDGSGEVPDVWESWQEVFAGLKADAETAAESAGASSNAATIAASNAESYASSAYHDKEAAAASASMASTYADAAQSSADDAAEWRDSAEMAADAAEAARDAADTAAADAAESAEKIIGLTAAAETLPEGSAASASYDSTTGTLTLGIPTGATGAQGPKGDTGEAGPQGIQGEIGPTGPAGYSPSASVVQTPDGATITITDATGTTSATLSDGKIWDNLDAETESYTPQVVVPCDDSGTAQGGVIAKRGRVLYINGTIPANTRVCIYGALRATQASPIYANYPAWYGEPCDSFVVGHTYKYTPEVLSGTIDNTSGNELLVLRRKDDTYKSIAAGASAVCEALPEAVFVLLRAGTYTNVKLYLHIVDVTASPVTDVQIDGSSIVSGSVAGIPLADTSTYGVIMIGTGLRLRNDGYVSPAGASEAQTKAGTASYYPIMPNIQHAATFYGLATAAGDTSQKSSSNAVGAYTDAAKGAIQSMLGISDLIAPVEGATASTAYSIGDVFLRAGKLYKVTAAISSGAAIVPGTNCTQTTIIELLRGV